MPDISKIPHRLDAAAASCICIVETPKGSRGKFNYDPELGLFRMKTLLPEGMSFPMDFGFIPSTLGGDGDPLDIMLLADEPTPMGVLVEARLIGVLEAEDTEEGEVQRNDRLLGVAQVSNLYEKVQVVGDLGQAFLDHLAQFWIHKGELEGKGFRLLGVGEPEAAVKLIRKGAKRVKRRE